MRLYNIRIEYSDADAESVTIIERKNPHFSWAVRKECSSAHKEEICVKVCQGGRLIWAENHVSPDTRELDYNGQDLVPGMLYTLSVSSHSETGEACGIERDFCLGTLPFWRAEWIYAPQPEAGQVICYTKTFTVDEDIQSICLYVGTMGFHRVELNGEPLVQAPMNPAVCEYDRRVYYQVFPITKDKLVYGKNLITISVADGWRTPDNCCYALTGRIPEFTGRVQTSALIALYRKDGSVHELYTDASWKWYCDPVRKSNLFAGETFDASFVSAGGSLEDCAERQSGFACSEKVSSNIEMRPQTVCPVCEQETYSPVCIWPRGGSRWIVDFGQNLAGVCRLAIPRGMRSGTKITVRYAETLDEEGELFTAPLRGAESTDRYISAAGKDPIEWQPVFTYHGFRYAEVSGYPGALLKQDITAVRYYTYCFLPDHFSCGSPMLNQIYRCCVETEKSNVQGILTDCPQRDERMGWMNDATVRFEAVPYVFDIGALFPKIARDCRDTQDEKGAIADTAPYAFGSRPADPVCSSFLLTGLETYLHQGSAEVIRENYDSYVKWTKYLLSKSDDYIVNYSWYGDWAAPAYACADREDARSLVTPGILMSTGYLYFNAVLLAKMASILHKEEDHSYFQELAEKVQAAFLAKWTDGTGKVGTGSEACQAFALWLQILPDEQRQKAAEILHRDLVNRKYAFTTGNLCTRYMLDVLAEYGYLEDAWILLTRDRYPSIGYMIQHQATTIWERFELKKDPTMNSHNHPMYGAVLSWFYRYLAGLSPVEDGWRIFRFSPCVPEHLGYVQASVRTRFGDIEMRWIKEYGHLHIDLAVPEGAEAQVQLPWGVSLVCAGGMHQWSTVWQSYDGDENQ